MSIENTLRITHIIDFGYASINMHTKTEASQMATDRYGEE